MQLNERIQDMFIFVTVPAGGLSGHRAEGLRNRVASILRECEGAHEAHGTGHSHDQAVP
jgi:hypothetical protein